MSLHLVAQGTHELAAGDRPRSDAGRAPASGERAAAGTSWPAAARRDPARPAISPLREPTLRRRRVSGGAVVMEGLLVSLVALAALPAWQALAGWIAGLVA